MCRRFIETDILGANQFGLASLLIANGIHKNQLKSNNNVISKSHLKKFFYKGKIIPEYVLNDFLKKNELKLTLTFNKNVYSEHMEND